MVAFVLTTVFISFAGSYLIYQKKHKKLNDNLLYNKWSLIGAILN